MRYDQVAYDRSIRKLFKKGDRIELINDNFSLKGTIVQNETTIDLSVWIRRDGYQQRQLICTNHIRFLSIKGATKGRKR